MRHYLKIPDEVILDILRETAPRCFHCGDDYIRDDKHYSNTHTTWMPACTCLNKSTIRVVTGEFSKEDY
tara:strand:+ start:142 stop:348 length:207 start_codon:yes stop_codon:yes gene_type:complete